LEKELVIRNTSNGVEIALLENGRLVELHQENDENSFKVGDVFLGRVNKVVPGLNAAFVDIGYEKDAFLHYTDLGPGFNTYLNFFKPILAGDASKKLDTLKYYPEIEKNGNVKDVLKNKTLIPVQVFKEPISTKGPRLTTEISIAGRFLILTPFSDTVGLSKKIANADERKRLKILIESLKPKNYGVIVRTVAEGKKASDLHSDLNALVQKWEMMIDNLKGASPKQKLLSEISKSSSLVRDIFNDNFTAITTTDGVMATDLQNYLAAVSPEKKNIVKHYKGKSPIFDHFEITKQIKSSFGKNVNFGKGPSLVIEHTEALHVIDVNSGHKIAMQGDQESNATLVNMEAAEEVARQLRLRDLGGIIVVDFIDMKKAENRKAVHDKMRELLKLDKATTNVLPLSKFNLMQITRQRVRPQVEIKTKENCPTCAGTGKIESTLLLFDKIENQIEILIAGKIKFSLLVHPFLEAYITKGFISKRMNWFLKHKVWVSVQAQDNFALTQFQFIDVKGEAIEIS
jgi:ribonuclease G